ncbi:hypothetical protein LX88_001120 [Lentzea californiensis]|nr:hypothetical protein [Lentzea californiensis]
MTIPPVTAARRPTALARIATVPPARFHRIAAVPSVCACVEPAEPGLSHHRSAESVHPQRCTAALSPRPHRAALHVTPGESARRGRTPAAPAARVLPASARLRFTAAGHPSGSGEAV